VSEILEALYRGDAATARELAREVHPDIFEASALGETKLVRQLLDDDPSLANAFGSDGFHPLGLACFFGHVDTARVLLEHGADLDTLSSNEHIQTAAIHAAAASGADEATRYELVKLLLDHGADRTCRRVAASAPSMPHARTATSSPKRPLGSVSVGA